MTDWTPPRPTKLEKEVLQALAAGLKFKRVEKGRLRLEGRDYAVRKSTVENMHNLGWIGNDLGITDLGRLVAEQESKEVNVAQEAVTKTATLLTAARRVLAAFDGVDQLERVDALNHLRSVVTSF